MTGENGDGSNKSFNGFVLPRNKELGKLGKMSSIIFPLKEKIIFKLTLKLYHHIFKIKTYFVIGQKLKQI